MVGLKYANKILCEDVITNSAGEPTLLICRVIPESEGAKPKGTIQWVPKSSSVVVEARIYNPLFTLEEPNDDTPDPRGEGRCSAVRARRLLCA